MPVVYCSKQQILRKCQSISIEGLFYTNTPAAELELFDDVTDFLEAMNVSVLPLDRVGYHLNKNDKIT